MESNIVWRARSGWQLRSFLGAAVGITTILITPFIAMMLPKTSPQGAPAALPLVLGELAVWITLSWALTCRAARRVELTERGLLVRNVVRSTDRGWFGYRDKLVRWSSVRSVELESPGRAHRWRSPVAALSRWFAGKGPYLVFRTRWMDEVVLATHQSMEHVWARLERVVPKSQLERIRDASQGSGTPTLL